MEEGYYDLSDGDGELDHNDEGFFFEAASDDAGDGSESETNRTVGAPLSSQVELRFLSRPSHPPPLAAASRRRPVTTCSCFSDCTAFGWSGGSGLAAGAMRLGAAGVGAIVMAIEFGMAVWWSVWWRKKWDEFGGYFYLFFCFDRNVLLFANVLNL